VQSLQSGKCLDLPGGDTTNGNKLWVWDCNGKNTQTWQFFENQLIYLGDTRKCVDLPGGATTNGNQLQIWDCNGHGSQKWGYDPNMKTIYLASSAMLNSSSNANKCMDLRWGGMNKGTAVEIWDCSGGGNKNQMWGSQPQGGPTDVTDQLNQAISRGKSGVYTGGKGLLVRNPFDNYEQSSWKVVPSTFWTNDIIVPTAVFPTGWGGFQHGNGDPNCANSQWNGFYKMKLCPTDARTGYSSPWLYATTGYIIGDRMNDVFPHFDKIQDTDWGYGVFYATDSNSVDQRCRWLSSLGGWDCPGYWLDKNGHASRDKSKLGAGNYDAGNAYAHGGGGGAGPHLQRPCQHGGPSHRHSGVS